MQFTNGSKLYQFFFSEVRTTAPLIEKNIAKHFFLEEGGKRGPMLLMRTLSCLYTCIFLNINNISISVWLAENLCDLRGVNFCPLVFSSFHYSLMNHYTLGVHFVKSVDIDIVSLLQNFLLILRLCCKLCTFLLHSISYWCIGHYVSNYLCRHDRPK